MFITSDIQHTNQRLNIFEQVVKLIIRYIKRPDNFDEVISCITRAIKPAEIGALFLYDASLEKLRLFSIWGEKNHVEIEIPQNGNLDLEDWITGKTFFTKRIQLYRYNDDPCMPLTDSSPDTKAWIEAVFGPFDQWYCLLGVPVCTDTDNLGVLLLGTHQTGASFQQEDVEFVHSLANVIAQTISLYPSNHQENLHPVLNHVDQMRAEALAILSHEMRTPLASIKGYATALLMDEINWPEEKRDEFLQLIDNETENLQTMINEILDSSLIDIGQFLLEFQPVKLDRIAQSVAEEMQQHTDEHQIMIDFPQDFPIIDADQRRIVQVFRNIIDNAIKYSPDGGLIVIRGEKRTKDVVISISDQGVGISPEDLIPLFNKYFRVKSATGYYIPGTGLGLPVARALIEEHQGKIWAESKVGEGTTLFFSLPFTQYESEN